MTSKYRLNLNVDRSIIEKAKEFAESEGFTLTSLIEKALRVYMDTALVLDKTLANPEGFIRIKSLAEAYNTLEADIMETEVEFKNQVALGLHEFKNTPIVPSRKGLKKLSRKQKEELSKIKDPQELTNQLDKTL